MREELLRLSFSQVMTYVRCPEHFLFRYILGVRNPPAKAMKQGLALHDTIAQDYARKQQKGKAFNIKEAQEFYMRLLRKHLEHYHKELEQSSFLLTKEFLKKEKETRSQDLLDMGTRGIALYKRAIEQKTEPELIEESFALPLKEGIELIGRIDLVDTHHIIHETKTAKKKPTLQQVATDPQLAFYQFAYEEIAGQRPSSLVKDFLVLQKRDVSIARYPVKKSSIGKHALFRYVGSIASAIRSNVWYCLHQADSWICSEGWCGYTQMHRELRRLGISRMKKKYSNFKKTHKSLTRLSSSHLNRVKDAVAQ